MLVAPHTALSGPTNRCAAVYKPTVADPAEIWSRKLSVCVATADTPEAPTSGSPASTLTAGNGRGRPGGFVGVLPEGVRMRRKLGIVLGLAAGLGAALAAPAPEEKTGPKVGEKAPEFTLKDQAGAERALKDLRKDGPVALVFYRSASW